VETNDPQVTVSNAGEGVISPKLFNLVSQIAHFFTTYALTFTAMMFKIRVGIGVAVACIIYAGIHEFWYDPHYENAVTRGSDLEDFFWLGFGALFAVFMGLAMRQ
jgi:hypothetical protein